PRRLLPRQRALGRRRPRRRHRFLLRLRRHPLYDVAIVVNDWCVNPDATLDHKRAHAFIHGYSVLRPMEAFERDLWPVMLRRAALRTWLGRLGYNYFPRDSHMTIDKDHEFSRRLLEHHIGNAHQ